MLVFCNAQRNLTVVIGSVVYELPMPSADKARRFAVKAAGDDDFMDVLRLACTVTPRVGSRTELENRDDPRMRFLGRRG